MEIACESEENEEPFKQFIQDMITELMLIGPNLG